MPGRIFLKYVYYRGGIGDFVRGALATFAFCKRNRLEFYFYIPDHPLRNCFELEDVKPQTNREFIYDVGNTNGAKQLENIFAQNSSAEIILITNAYQFVAEDELLAAVPEFMQVFKPSASVRAKIDQLHQTLMVGPGAYVSLHMRCGDAYMRDYDRYCPGDARCEPAEALNKVRVAVSRIREKTHLPIVFHSDNYGLRMAVAEQLNCLIPQTAIQHTAQHAIRPDDFVETVAEFFVVGQAATIYSLIPSGFTKWAAAIFGRPLEPLST